MPDAISVFGILIPVVRASLVLGLLLAVWLALRVSKLMGAEAKALESAAIGVTLAGLIGARLGFVIMNWGAFQDDLLSALYVWHSGYLPWSGVFIGGVYAYVRYELKPLYLRSLLIAFGVAALLPLITFEATKLRLPNSNALLLGDATPEVRMVNLEGKAVSLRDLRGQVVVLNFWATWCPPCRREMPMLESVARAYQNRDVAIIGFDVGETASRILETTSSLGVNYPIWLDGSDTDSSHLIYRMFGGVGLPTTVFIDRNGLLRARQIGELSRASLIANLESLLP